MQDTSERTADNETGADEKRSIWTTTEITKECLELAQEACPNGYKFRFWISEVLRTALLDELECGGSEPANADGLRTDIHAHDIPEELMKRFIGTAERDMLSVSDIVRRCLDQALPPLEQVEESYSNSVEKYT